MTEVLSTVAIIAEDIREESLGTISLIGILPDNLNYEVQENVEQLPHLPKLVVYVRTLISHSDEITDGLNIEFRSPSGKVIAQNPVSAEFLAEKKNETEAAGSPQTTIISQIRFSPFPLLENGRYEIATTCGEKTWRAGFFNVIGHKSDNPESE